MICPVCAYDNLPGSETCRHCQHDLTQLDRPVAHDRIERSLMEDSVAALKPQPAVTLLPTATVREAIQTMLDSNIGALLVVGDDRRLLGIFSERDLMTRIADPTADHSDRPIGEFMTPNPETVRSTDSLAFALHKMDLGGYRHLPVLKDGQPFGMISVRDMLRHITNLCKER
jgi:CBS domain-containing protein